MEIPTYQVELRYMVGTLPFAHTAFIKIAEDKLFCLDKLLRTNFTPFSMQQIEKKDKTKKDRKKNKQKKMIKKSHAQSERALG